MTYLWCTSRLTFSFVSLWWFSTLQHSFNSLYSTCKQTFPFIVKIVLFFYFKWTHSMSTPIGPTTILRMKMTTFSKYQLHMPQPWLHISVHIMSIMWTPNSCIGFWSSTNKTLNPHNNYTQTSNTTYFGALESQSIANKNHLKLSNQVETPIHDNIRKLVTCECKEHRMKSWMC